MTGFAAVRAAADRLRPRAAVVLGSGLGGATAGFGPDASAPYADVPGLVPPTVPGHRGQLAVGHWAGVPTLVFAGRIHFYEGHPPELVTRTVEIAAELGVKLLVLTNAAGGIHPALGPGSLMVIRDHLKLLHREAWKLLASGGRKPPVDPPPGDPPPTVDPQHPGVAPHRGAVSQQIEAPHPVEAPQQGANAPRSPYSPRLVALLRQIAPSLHVGTYAAVTGPCYETPAEIRALAALGADAVGMSTALEADAAVALGLEVCGLSSVTNRAAGLSAGVLTHADVEEVAKRNAGRLGVLIGQLLRRERRADAPLSPG